MEDELYSLSDEISGYLEVLKNAKDVIEDNKEMASETLEEFENLLNELEEDSELYNEFEPMVLSFKIQLDN